MPRPYQCRRHECDTCHTERDQIEFFGRNGESTCLLCHAKKRNLERHRQTRLAATLKGVLGRETRRAEVAAEYEAGRQASLRAVWGTLGDLEADYGDNAEDIDEDDDEDASW